MLTINKNTTIKVKKKSRVDFMTLVEAQTVHPEKKEQRQRTWVQIQGQQWDSGECRGILF